MPDESQAPAFPIDTPADSISVVIGRLNAIERACTGKPQMGQRPLVASAVRATIVRLRETRENIVRLDAIATAELARLGPAAARWDVVECLLGRGMDPANAILAARLATPEKLGRILDGELLG